MGYGNSDPFGWGECDREATNESDGRHFYGYDSGDGPTVWYDEYGCCDSTTATPDDDDW